MRVAYGDSNVLRCNIQFAYDRFFTSHTKTATHFHFPQNQADGQAKDTGLSSDLGATTTFEEITENRKKIRDKLNNPDPSSYSELLNTSATFGGLAF